MISKRTIRRKLMQLLLLASLVTLVTAVVLDVVLRKRSAALYTQSEITDRWLKGRVVNADPRINHILMTLSSKLAKLKDDFRAPEARQVQAPLFGPTEKEKPVDRTYQLPIKEESDLVYTDFDGAAYYPFDPKDFVKDNQAPDQRDYDRDKLSYKSFMFPFVKATKEAKIQEERDVNVALQKYSEAMFKELGVERSLTQELPKLTVGNVYASSSNGTLAIFPWNSINLAKHPNWRLKERKWHRSANGLELQGTEILPFPNGGDPSSSFGLSPHYIDAVSGDFARTLWHKFTVRENGEDVTYILCIDLILSSSLPQSPVTEYLPSWFKARGGFIESLLLGVASGLIVLALGSILILLLSKLWPNRLSNFIVRRKPDTKPDAKPDDWETEQSFIPIKQAFALSRSITFTNVVKNEEGIEGKVNFSAWFQMAVSKLSLEKSTFKRDLIQTEQRDEVTLGTIDKDPSLRGYEMWQVVSSRRRSEGNCRLCDQAVKYKEADELIARPAIRHRRAQLPSIDARLEPNSSVKDTKALEEAIIWHATDVEPKTLGTEHVLTPPPTLRIPQSIQGLSMFQSALRTYEMLVQSRVEVNDCVKLSIELFRNRNVRAVCHIDYFRKIADDGNDSLAALMQGKNIERILIANKPEDMVNFLSKHHETIVDLVNARNHDLFRLYLDDTGVDFNTFGNQWFDLDFALVYGENDVPMVLASNLSELNSGGNVKGYLSWRKVDVSFFETLYQSFNDKRVTLSLDDLPRAPPVTVTAFD